MNCERCGVENRAGRRFCAACGAALPHPCASCGFVNQLDDKFCGGCGIALRAEHAAAPIRNDGSGEEFGERHQVTILFADLYGYTSLASRRDPEETHRILGRFFEAVDSAVTKYGGTIERHIGDNVMGVFGAPVAHGDDPLRANPQRTFTMRSSG
ncbi:MAG: zinc ribbon domain-containing protein [Microvirga sp.]